MGNRSIVSIADYSREKIQYLLDMAAEFEKRPNRKMSGRQSSCNTFFRAVYKNTTQL